MLPHTVPDRLNPQPSPKVTADELVELRVACEGYIAKGGEIGSVAGKILSISERMQALSAKIDRCLGS